MRKLFLLVSIFITVFQIQLQAQYKEAMKDALEAAGNAKSPADFTETINTFLRISDAEADEWLPEYYAAYYKSILAFITDDIKTKDMLLDQAWQLSESAEKKSPDNSEVYALKAFINSLMISLDPMNRGYKLGMKTAQYLGIAKKLNPDNPRVYLIEAENTYYTPEQFGGGKEKAYKMLETCRAKYMNFVPESEISPDWGKEQLEKLLASYVKK